MTNGNVHIFYLKVLLFDIKSFVSSILVKMDLHSVNCGSATKTTLSMRAINYRVRSDAAVCIATEKKFKRLANDDVKINNTQKI